MLGDVIYDVGLYYDIDFSSLWSFIFIVLYYLCVILGICTFIRVGCVYIYIYKMLVSEFCILYMLENVCYFIYCKILDLIFYY